MNLSKFIKSHKELNELPFLVVYSTLQILQNLGLLRTDNDNDVETIQR